MNDNNPYVSWPSVVRGKYFAKLNDSVPICTKFKCFEYWKFNSTGLMIGNFCVLILGEFFSKNEVAKTLVAVAKEFEQIAMSKKFAFHGNESVELRSMLFCLLDYWGITT